ncbi:hypothetical protein PDE_03175 [Penicillium oxalicum 114-2]|uniref:Uncharacterized protein n=1 Tax=Penicillium oxalicum (strain 114-2 / CGMCC 5302) TaxID=933388 RepID=S7ZD91_PENO1|nr:hypothetical protein PDE_03175 [Penicillium oxalicum 114-2]
MVKGSLTIYEHNESRPLLPSAKWVQLGWTPPWTPGGERTRDDVVTVSG